MKVLIPLLSKDESNEQFLGKASEKADQVTLLTVIDTMSGNEKFGFTAGQIGASSSLAEKMKKKLKETVKEIDQVLEWGDTLTKIEQIAKLKKVDLIAMKKQQNQFFEQLVEHLKERKLKVEVFE